jgi:hypothetical protein
MAKLRVVKDGDASNGLTGSALFGHLWGALADLLGASATATLVSRAARRAGGQHPVLRELVITRIDAQFSYVVPSSFHQALGPPPPLQALVRELQPLLADATGAVAVRHLVRVPELRGWLKAA